MAIDRTEVLEDVKLYTIGLTNPMTDANMLSIIDDVISAVGTADSYYAEVVCKSLRSIAGILSSTTTLGSTLKSEEINNKLKRVYQDNDVVPWEKYESKLDGICASLGYEDAVSVALGIYIPTQESIVVETEIMREEIQENYDCCITYDEDIDYYDLGDS